MSRAAGTGFFRTASFVVAVALTGVLPLRAGAENLADALVGAYNTSGLLEQNRALLRATDETVGIAMSTLRPVVAWTATAARGFSQVRLGAISTSTQTSTYGLGLTAQVLLYDGGAAAVGIQGAKESVLAARQGLLSVEQSILFTTMSG